MSATSTVERLSRLATEDADQAYRGYLIRTNLVGDLWVEKDGILITYASNVAGAKKVIDGLVGGTSTSDAIGVTRAASGPQARALLADQAALAAWAEGTGMSADEARAWLMRQFPSVAFTDAGDIVAGLATLATADQSHEVRFERNTQTGQARAMCSCGWTATGTLEEVQRAAATHDLNTSDAFPSRSVPVEQVEIGQMVLFGQEGRYLAVTGKTPGDANTTTLYCAGGGYKYTNGTRVQIQTQDSSGAFLGGGDGGGNDPLWEVTWQLGVQKPKTKRTRAPDKEMALLDTQPGADYHVVKVERVRDSLSRIETEDAVARLAELATRDSEADVAGMKYSAFVRLVNKIAREMDADSNYHEAVSIAESMGATTEQADAIARDLGRVP